MIYDNNELTFEELLKRLIIHNLSLKYSDAIFINNLLTQKSSSYTVYSKCDFVIPQVRIVLKGSNSIRYYSPIIWSLVPEEIRYIYRFLRKQLKIGLEGGNLMIVHVSVQFLEIFKKSVKCKIVFSVLFILVVY